MWMKQERVHGGQAAAASTQVEEEDDSVAAVGAEVGEVNWEVEKLLWGFVLSMCLMPLLCRTLC